MAVSVKMNAKCDKLNAVVRNVDRIICNTRVKHEYAPHRQINSDEICSQSQKSP